MTWPAEIYVGTVSLGVYHTTDFAGPGTQPTWTAINDGLAGLDLLEFGVDPFEPARYQYVLVEADYTLYRRVDGGAWAPILTPAECIALTPNTLGVIRSFWADPSIEGRLWVSFGHGNTTTNGHYALHSDDRGATWAASEVIYIGSLNMAQELGNILALGNSVWVSYAINTGPRIGVSSNGGASWGAVDQGFEHLHRPLTINFPLEPGYMYYKRADSVLATMTDAGASVDLRDPMPMATRDSIWFSANSADHQRMVSGQTLYSTHDRWVNVAHTTTIDMISVAFAPWAGADEDQMIVGRRRSSSEHALGVLYGETDTTVTGIAGAAHNASPYTDSIPATCGGVCVRGIQAIPAHVITGQWRIYSCMEEAVT